MKIRSNINAKLKGYTALFGIGLLMLIICLIFSSCGSANVYEPNSINAENARASLDTFHIDVDFSDLVEGEIPEKLPDTSSDVGDFSGGFMYELPDISNYELSVEGSGDIDIEIFVPSEDNGSSILQFVTEAANSFNNAGYTLTSGEKVSVSVRSLEASLAEDYILSGSYYPAGYIASNELYGKLMEENGINVSLVTSRTAGNTMGIVLSKAKYDELCGKYGALDVAKIVEANANGDISVGYTNPTNNPTGLNFVISMLSYFDANNPMSMEATTDFSNFQNAVPMVSYSTSQMISSVEIGTIDAFVLERQAFENNRALDDYVFMTFGVRHDNPLYAIGELKPEELEVLKLFSNFMQSDVSQKYATELGFNKENAYVSTVGNYSGDMITTILDFWKTEKASGKKIAVVFVADRSGSMDGRKMEALQNSMITAMQYIGEDCRVGIVSYASNVSIDLPIGEFSEQQQKYFVGATNSLVATGGTSTNDALLIATKLLVDEMAENSNTKPLIILLSDGQTGSGYSLSSMRELLKFYGIPMYTIGYEAHVDELETIAAINGGAFINADSEDIGYHLKTLFDAEM